jgi:hypothetical protein
MTDLLRMQQRAKAYQVIGNVLYKTSVTWPLLHCLSKADGIELLAGIHSGICRGSHQLQKPCRKSIQTRVLLAIDH